VRFSLRAKQGSVFEISCELDIYVERVTRIELALSAWELACQVSVTSASQVSGHHWLSVSGRRVPVLTPPSGTQRARERSPHAIDNHQIRSDLQPHSLPAHPIDDLLEYWSALSSEQRH
jgi:hypothetical protein